MPILDQDTLEFISRSPEQTQRIGARLGGLLKGGAVIALEGNLGAGKTLLAQGIGAGWGADAPLISPTFVFIRRYTRLADACLLYHVDLYRLSVEAETRELGLDELLGAPQTVCIVEWPDRAPSSFPAEHLWITLRWAEEMRRALIFHAHGAHHRALLEQFRKEIVGR